MIRRFKDAETERLWNGERTKRFGGIEKQAVRKIAMLQVAEKLEDLRSPPGNRLEVLQGNRKGQHSIRINDQWRLCFIWTDDGATDVEISD
jgi:toxin HigB-1